VGEETRRSGFNLKLEIGSGRTPHSGYETIDIEAYAKPTYLGDFRKMSFSEVEEIRANHLLEHFSRQEAIEVLKQWRSWLKDGGRLIVETPDFEGICYYFTQQPIRLWGTREMLVMATYGSQEADWAFHRDGWYEEKFKEILPKLGFKIILIKKKHNYYRNENRIRFRLPVILVIAEKI
jgi:hypothetical protein